ncbi:peroxiredoxin-like family protein [Marinicella meishanensis]|uniref:peroxiredoxin-like family protein n=1 Tax=Marinicella meishanensis TaxID=2873263 RepID=UPI001CC13F83|nr:peroxiredoxin-like family protein [Marinicella sp. NBU2979]
MKTITTFALAVGLALAAIANQTLAKDYFDQADQVTPLLPGMAIPAFTAQTPAGETVVFAPEQIEKPFVLTFYRGGWCPYCRAHLGEMRLAEAELVKLGFDVYFMSPDQPSFLAESIQLAQQQAADEEKFDYQLLSDADMSVARAFRIAFKVEDELVEKYKQWNIDLEKASGHDHHLLPAPAVFLVGTDGVIQFQYVNPDYKIRLAPAILLAAAKDYLKRQPN